MMIDSRRVSAMILAAAPAAMPAIASAAEGSEATIIVTPFLAIFGGLILFALPIILLQWRASTRRAEHFREKEEAVQEIIDRLPDLFFRTDSEGLIQIISPSCRNLLGYEPEELIGRSFKEIHSDPEKRDEHVRNIVSKAGETVFFDVFIFHRDGHKVAFDVHAFARFDDQGKFTGIEGVSRDISAQKAAEEALKESEERYELAVRHAAIWDWNLETDILYCSPYFRKMLKYDEEEFEAVLRRTIKSIIHPNERGVFGREIAHMLDHPHELYESEHRYRLGDGTYRWFASRGQCIADADGKPVRATGFIIDIHDRKKVEAATTRLGRIIEKSFGEIFLFDVHKLRFTTVNGGALENLGYADSEIRKLSLPDIMPEISKDDFLHMLGPLYFGARHSLAFETVFQRKSGSIYPVDVRIEMMQQEDPPVFVAIVSDISDRREKDQQLLQAVRSAEDANRAKSEFLASMSHELRTPLNAVIGFAQMLDFDPANPLTDAQRENVESILEGGRHLLELVNSILDLAQIESDRIDLHVENVAVENVIRDCMTLTRPLTEKDGITVSCDAVGGEITTDILRFKQCLLNLLSNAIKYNRPGGSVSISTQTNDRGFLRISVTDTGIGILEKDKAGIFQKFQRLNADPTIAREGTGIGLTVTKMLVEKLGGRIGFSSDWQKGSNFWIELPLSINANVLFWSSDMRTHSDAVDRHNQMVVDAINLLAHQPVSRNDCAEALGRFIDLTGKALQRERMIMQISGIGGPNERLTRIDAYQKSLSEKVARWHMEPTSANLQAIRDHAIGWWTEHFKWDRDVLAPRAASHEREIRQALRELS
jgi:PAS domain S-box-containing protein